MIWIGRVLWYSLCMDHWEKMANHTYSLQIQMYEIIMLKYMYLDNYVVVFLWLTLHKETLCSKTFLCIHIINTDIYIMYIHSSFLSLRSRDLLVLLLLWSYRNNLKIWSMSRPSWSFLFHSLSIVRYIEEIVMNCCMLTATLYTNLYLCFCRSLIKVLFSYFWTKF